MMISLQLERYEALLVKALLSHAIAELHAYSPPREWCSHVVAGEIGAVLARLEELILKQAEVVEGMRQQAAVR